MARRKEELNEAVAFSWEMHEYNNQVTSQLYGATEEAMEMLMNPSPVRLVYSDGEAGPTLPSKITAKPAPEVHHSYAAQLKAFALKESAHEELVADINSIMEEDQIAATQDRTLWRNGSLTHQAMDEVYYSTPRDCPKQIAEEDYSEESRP